MNVDQRQRRVIIMLVLALAFMPGAGLALDAEAPQSGDAAQGPAATLEPTGEQLIEPFEDTDWHTDPGWLDYRAIDAERGMITPAGYHGSGLDVTIPGGARRGSGALYLLPEEVDEAWFRYHIILDDWEAVDSGKLPGFADIGASSARGCVPSSPGDPGWSARVLFEQTGTADAGPDQIRLGYYTYHLDQPGSCGDFMLWNDNGIIDQSRWYCIEGRVQMNTPGSSDGKLSAWIDGTQVYGNGALAFRRTGEEHINVNTFWLNVYFGGSVIVNETDLGLRIDELVVDTERVGCLTRFTDDDDSPHEAHIENLFDRGVILGCAQNLFCPDRPLKRSELLAMIDRYFDLSPTDQDFFDDDAGHWSEPLLNRAAAAGVLKGCGVRLACPSQLVTRAETAAFIARAFDVPTSEADAFTDDDGSVFENDINAIAAVAITSGCAELRYCPDRDIPRDQAAALFSRAIAWYESG